jgi:hypothetical protein
MTGANEMLKLTLAEITRLVIDLEDARDGISERIAAIQERINSIRAEIKSGGQDG